MDDYCGLQDIDPDVSRSVMDDGFMVMSKLLDALHVSNRKNILTRLEHSKPFPLHLVSFILLLS